MDNLKSYFDLILVDKHWSWVLITVVYLVIAMMVRAWFFGGLKWELRALDKNVQKKIKAGYLKRSLPGWILFLVPAAIAFIWNRTDILPITMREVFLILLSVGCYLLSVIFHLQAFAVAAIQVQSPAPHIHPHTASETY